MHAASDERHRARHQGRPLDTMLGKILRVDVRGGGYTVPPSNPFAQVPSTEPSIWAYGLRNPWRFSFDRDTGVLWAGDVGQDAWEEIDQIERGGNYGWNTCEGFHKRGDTVNLCATEGLVAPIVEHGRAEARAIVGGYVYHGKALPSLAGAYIYGDCETGSIWALRSEPGNRAIPTPIAQLSAERLVSFAEGNDGELYAVVGDRHRKAGAARTAPAGHVP